MPQTVNINGIAISYPVIGDTEWGVEATKFAELVGVVLQKIGQGNQSTTNNIVIGSISSPGNLTVASGDLSVSGNTALTGKVTVGGAIVADDSTNVTTAPPITFTGDLNTGIGHSSADTLDFVTGGVPRARISSTGQQSSVVPDLSGSNTNLFLEYKCRAWVNFDGTGSGTITPRASGNVISVTKISTGVYDINLTTAMPDSNYSFLMTTKENFIVGENGYNASTVGIAIRNNSGTLADVAQVGVAIFR